MRAERIQFCHRTMAIIGGLLLVANQALRQPGGSNRGG